MDVQAATILPFEPLLTALSKLLMTQKNHAYSCVFLTPLLVVKPKVGNFFQTRTRLVFSYVNSEFLFNFHRGSQNRFLRSAGPHVCTYKSLEVGKNRAVIIFRAHIETFSFFDR